MEYSEKGDEGRKVEVPNAEGERQKIRDEYEHCQCLK
jgi:hypothetical protein